VVETKKRHPIHGPARQVVEQIITVIELGEAGHYSIGGVGMVHKVPLRNKSTFTNSDGFSIVSGKLKQLTS
jgi:hypothetical protein